MAPASDRQLASSEVYSGEHGWLTGKKTLFHGRARSESRPLRNWQTSRDVAVRPNAEVRAYSATFKLETVAEFARADFSETLRRIAHIYCVERLRSCLHRQ
jgi:hypothetical protein